jgi:hypothetical protein
MRNASTGDAIPQQDERTTEHIAQNWNWNGREPQTRQANHLP